MPRLNPSGDATFSLKCSDELLEQIDAAVESSSCSSRSEWARNELAEAAQETLGKEPESPELTARQQKALVLLSENTYPNGKIPSDEARSIISENMGIKKERVKRAVFEPLEDAGAIKPTWGQIRVKP